MKKISYFASVFVLGVSFAAPLLAFAAGINTGYLEGYKKSITDIINTILVPMLIAIAFLVFLWGIYYYFIKGAANEEDRAKGRVFTLYGIIGLVIIFSIWGIVEIFSSTLGLPAANAPAPPTIGGSGGASGNPSATTAFPSAGSATPGGTGGDGSFGSSCGGPNDATCSGILICVNGYCTDTSGSGANNGPCYDDYGNVTNCATSNNGNTTTGNCTDPDADNYGNVGPCTYNIY